MAASLVQSSHAAYYGFSTIAWKAAGFDGVAIGALWALGVIAEIVLFALSGRLPHSFGAVPLLMVGAAGAVLRWTAMPFDPPGWTLPLLQCLHALSFGASHLGAIAYLAHAAPEGRGATAQGYFSIAQGVTLSFCMLLAGFLYERVGAMSYLAMAVVALCGGLIAGMASALSVAIGMEMMVYLAGAGGLIALRWVFKEGAARRMAPYALALGSGTGLLYAAFASTDNQGIACDAISLNWTATLILAAGGMVLLSLLRLQGWPKRLAAGALVGAIVAAFTYHFWPQCITSVYQIDPELDRLWLSHIREAKPITAQSLSSAIQIVALPVGGLIAALVGCFAARGDKERLWAWGSVMLMVAFALGLTFWQIRSGPAAQLVAIPAVAWVGYGALEWLVRGSIGERLSALLALLIALLSFNGDFIYPQLQKVGLVAPPAPATAATKARDARFKRINTANGRCRTQPALVALNQLPPATIMTMVDLGPRLIAMTHHSAIAGPYHRNGKAILDLHHAYDGDAATFLDTARRHHATYFLLCPDFPEGTIYRARSPGGMYDQLEKGQIPVWLKPVELKTGYKLPYTLYRIEGGAQSVENLGDRIEPGSNLSAVGKERDVPAR